MVSCAKVKASISKMLGLLLKYIWMVWSGFNADPIQRDSTLGGLHLFLTNIKHSSLYKLLRYHQYMCVFPHKLSLHVCFLPFQVLFSEPDPPSVGVSDMGKDLEHLLKVHTTYLFLSSTWNLTFHLEPIHQIQFDECRILFMPITESTN